MTALDAAVTAAAVPPPDCALCPRLASFRRDARAAEPEWFNAPVPTFGVASARLLVVGLAPGLKGANRTGRPFTGDFAGELLYKTLLEFGFASGSYDRRADDSLVLEDCAVTNAVRCVPPQNKPLPVEVRTCRAYLEAQIAAMSKLRAVIALGRIAHESTVRALGRRPSATPFAHAARADIERPGAPAVALFTSYHCSRYNTNTGVLTEAMFREVFRAARAELDAGA